MTVVGQSGFPSASEALSLIRSLLNDVDTPSDPVTIAVLGAVRASNVVTITTNTVHGMVVGDIITVQGTLSGTYDGSFTVDAVPTSTTLTYSQVAGDETGGTGFIQLVAQGDVFTDTMLLPLLNAAYRKVQRKLSNSASPTETGQEDLGTLTAGGVILDSTSTPALPSDFIAPKEMYEKLSSDTFYIPMTLCQVLPERAQGTYLGDWAWREDAIQLVGALSDVMVRIRYYRSLSPLTSGNSVIQIRDGLDPVAFWAAHLAALSRGSSLAVVLKSQFDEAMNEVLSTQAFSKQYRPTRRMPYNAMSNRGRRSGGRY